MISYWLNFKEVIRAMLIAQFLWFFLPSVISRATDFELEKVVFRGKTFSTVETSLERYWLRRPRPVFAATSSSYPNGYEAKWEVTDDKFMLTSLKGGLDNRDLDTKLLLDAPLPILADWFTGTIDLVEGELGSGVIGRCRDQWRLQVVRGILVKAEFIGESLIQWPGRIGLSFSQKENKWFIDEVAKNSPADLSNRFRDGDEVISVESNEWGHKDVEGISIFDLVGFCRGPVASNVRITIRRFQSLDTVSLQRVESFAE